MTNTKLFSEDFGTTILTEVKMTVRKNKAKYPMLDVTELESFLVSEIWNELLDKPESFCDIRMVKRLCGLRTINYIKGAVKNSHITSVTDSEGEDVAIIDTLESKSVDIELSDQLKSFRATLTERQVQILDLVTDGYGTNEICKMLNVSINTPKNTMKKIKELALDFGLYL